MTAKRDLDEYFPVYKLCREFKGQSTFADPLSMAIKKQYKLPKQGTVHFAQYLENLRLTLLYMDNEKGDY